MEIRTEDIGAYIETYYQEKDSSLIITKRIRDGLQATILNNINLNVPNMLGDARCIQEREIEKFLENEKVLHFIKERQPNVEIISDCVISNIQKYFLKQLPEYQIVTVCRKSNHPDDADTYSIIARKDPGEFACWTSWDEARGILNYGHYGLETEEAALSILKDNFFDITNETQKYGIEVSKRGVSKETNLSTEEFVNRDNITFRRRGGR